MDSEKETTSKPISEFNEAKKRFKKLTEKQEDSFEDPSSSRLDAIIQKLCNRDISVNIGIDSGLFYEVLFHSDYIQIKDDVKEIFYSELYNTFILSDLVGDIVENLDKLGVIPHVRTSLASGFIKVLQIAPVLENECLILRYCNENIWHNFDINKVHIVQLCPCAYKVMFSNPKFNLTHFNFFLHLFQIETLILNGCNLNGRNIQDLFRGLKLKSLQLSDCGTSVNEIILNDSSAVLLNLIHLDVSKNPIYNNSLERLSHIPLRELNMSECIKMSGQFINSIWFAEKFTLQTKGEQAKGDIDLLLSQGVLKEKIEVLNVSFNHISLDNLKKILNLNLRELDITGSLKVVEFSKVSFPESLKILRARQNEVRSNDVKALCNLQLERVEIDYYARDEEDFSELYHSPLTYTLKEMSVGFYEASEKIITFISKIEFKYFECDLKTEDCFIDSFFINYSEERKHLEVLKLVGPAVYLTNEWISALQKLELKEFSISLESSVYSNINFYKILTSEVLQKTLVTLRLHDKEVDDDDLELLRKFKNLKNLYFTFSNGISDERLKSIVQMENLEKLELEAVVHGLMNLELVRLMCVASVKTLRIYDDYSESISQEAVQYLSTAENYNSFSKNLVNLHMRSVIKPNLAKILKGVNWKSITLDNCVDDDKNLKLVLNNNHLVYTLEYLKFNDLEIDWEDLSKLNLSKLDIQIIDIPNEIIPILSKGTISKSLKSLFLERNNLEVDLLLYSNLSQVDTY